MKWGWVQPLPDEVAEDDALLQSAVETGRAQWKRSAEKAGYTTDETTITHKISETLPGMEWYTDPETGEQIRLPRFALQVSGYLKDNA